MAFVNVVNNIFSQFLLPTVYKQKYSHESSFKRIYDLCPKVIAVVVFYQMHPPRAKFVLTNLASNIKVHFSSFSICELK